MKILVTGSNGFVGRELVSKLRELGHEVVPAVRANSNISGHVIIGEIDSRTDWQRALAGVDVVVHLAARVHVMKEDPQLSKEAYRRTNTEGTVNLAKHAVAAGVSRFIFLSTVKVNGESTEGGKAFCADDVPNPVGPYSESKWEAEKELLTLSKTNPFEVVIIRPPLVYGRGVKGNFLSLLQWIKKGIPLPMGSIHNRRSLVSLDNLVSLIVKCIDHPSAANQIFLVSDGEDLSTSDLIKNLAKALNVNVWLIPVPSGLMQVALAMFGKKELAQRLLGSLQVDIQKNKKVLGWHPPFTVEESLSRFVRGNVLAYGIQNESTER